MSLLLARSNLHKRAFITRRNIMLEAFQWLDRLFNRMNSVTGGIVLVNDTNSLPDERPIAWREKAKKSLGTFRYLFRVCTALELPILFVGATINVSTVRTCSPMSALLYILWGIATVMICVHASGVITAERSRQTLDVLLVAPLTGDEILRQKMAGVWRLIAVLLVPFLTIYGFQLWFRGFDFGYLLGSAASVLILLPLMAWIALAVGLRVRSAIKAILISLGLVVVLCVVPFVAVEAVTTVLGGHRYPRVEAISSLSPIRIISLLESRGVVHHRFSDSMFWFSLLPLVIYGLLWRRVRQNCLIHADRLLQRVADDPSGAHSMRFGENPTQTSEQARVSQRRRHVMRPEPARRTRFEMAKRTMASRRCDDSGNGEVRSRFVGQCDATRANFCESTEVVPEPDRRHGRTAK